MDRKLDLLQSDYNVGYIWDKCPLHYFGFTLPSLEISMIIFTGSIIPMCDLHLLNESIRYEMSNVLGDKQE